jgi:hypothetical protein
VRCGTCNITFGESSRSEYHIFKHLIAKHEPIIALPRKSNDPQGNKNYQQKSCSSFFPVFPKKESNALPVTYVSIPATKATDVTKSSARLVASSPDAGGGMPCLGYDAPLPEPKVVNYPHAIGQVQPSVMDKFYFDTSTGTIRSQNCGRKAKYDSPSDMCLQ